MMKRLFLKIVAALEGWLLVRVAKIRQDHCNKIFLNPR